MIKAVFILLAAVAALFLILYFVPISSSFLNNMVITSVEKKYNLDINVSGMTIWPLKRVEIKDLAVDNKKGLSLASGAASAEYNIFSVPLGFIAGHIQLNGVVLKEDFARKILSKFAIPDRALSSAKMSFSDIGTDFKLHSGRLETYNLVINGKSGAGENIGPILNFLIHRKEK